MLVALGFDTEKKNYARTSVSFFNELSTEKKNYARNLSLIMASKRTISGRNTCQGTNVSHGFQEIFARWQKNTLEGIHVDDLDKGREIWL
jgi:hypothetical protein